MATTTKRMFYVRDPHPAFLERIAARNDLTLEKVDQNAADGEIDAVLSQAHIYYIPSARGPLQPRFYADHDLLLRTPRLLVVSASGAGHDPVNVSACTEAGIIVVNQTGSNREAVAEHVLGMMIILSRRIIVSDRTLRRQASGPADKTESADLLGKTLGIIGLGNVGGRLAEIAAGMLAMKILAYDPYLSAEQITAKHATKTTLEDLLRRSDFVSVNTPLTDETRGMIGAREYALMQPHAYFINAARGGIHDERALAEALKAGRLAGAGLDVWAVEPPPADHPLLALDNVISSPHTAGSSRESRVAMATWGADQIMDILDGKRPPRLVNPEAWPAYARRFEMEFGFRPQG
jgi:D-3-phosphoglycerate dehydrogenase